MTAQVMLSLKPSVCSRVQEVDVGQSVPKDELALLLKQAAKLREDDDIWDLLCAVQREVNERKRARARSMKVYMVKDYDAVYGIFASEKDAEAVAEYRGGDVFEEEVLTSTAETLPEGYEQTLQERRAQRAALEARWAEEAALEKAEEAVKTRATLEALDRDLGTNI